MKRASKLTTKRTTTSLPRSKAKEFYQTTAWKKCREKLRKKRRKEHEQIVLEVYEGNDANDPRDLVAFLRSNMPLSEPHLKEGIIKVASVLDHKKRIRSGGAKFAPSNLQWVTTEYHNRKSGQEAHE